MLKINTNTFRYGLRAVMLLSLAIGAFLSHHCSAKPKSILTKPDIAAQPPTPPGNTAHSPQAQDGMQPSKDDWELMAAIDANNYPLAKRLIAKYPALVHHDFILGEALYPGQGDVNYPWHLRFVKLILDSGVELNPKIKKDSGYTTPLAATVYGDPQCTELLLDYGAKVDTKDDEGNTALVKAAEVGNDGVALVLLKHGAKVDASGGLALCLAAKEGNFSTVKLLLRHGANIHLLDKKVNISPLWYAASNNHVDVVDYLIRHGANVNITNQWGSSALEIAENMGYDEVVARLIKAGARR